MKKYIVRLDDASPTMVEDRWMRVYRILKNYGVMPLVGVIPHNEDPAQQNPVIKDFWDKMCKWQADGATMALHGYNHCYTSDRGLEGLNPLWSRSEFAGLPFEVQKQKIDDGFKILVEKGLHPTVFFAPSHTYDENTLRCLKECTTIEVVSDTMALKPYKAHGMTFVPQQSGHFMVPKLPGLWTFCFHPNTMMDEQINRFELYIKTHRADFISFKDIELTNLRNKSMIDKLLSWAYFTQRKMK